MTLPGSSAGEPVSRVLYPRRYPLARTFAGMATIPLGDALLHRSCDQPGRLGAKPACLGFRQGAPSLFGLAPGGVCRAAAVTSGAVRSCRTLSPLPVLTTPERARAIGGLLSVALSLEQQRKRRCPGGRYPPPSFRGARTFLGIASFWASSDAAARLPGPAVHSTAIAKKNGLSGTPHVAFQQQLEQQCTAQAIDLAIYALGPPAALEGADCRPPVGNIVAEAL